MPLHRFEDPEFWDAVTSDSLRWTQDAARGAGLEIGSTILGDEADMSAPMVSILQLPPGGVLPRHAHHCHRVEVLISGSLDAGDGVVLGPGDTMISKPGDFYGPHIAGPEGALTVEVFSEASANTEFAPVDDPDVAATISAALAHLEKGKTGGAPKRGGQRT